ncbi:MAG: nucleotidyltransferase [Deltaproteobacteria bacterium]|nr:nucleotidyltransferase [Deltaproteobacteria bacterium]
MTSVPDLTSLTQQIRESLDDCEDILFAYLYGSAAYGPTRSAGDIDIAVYLMPATADEYLKKEAALTSLLVSGLHTDDIDLRILNVLPVVLQYDILKEGILVLSRDEMQRAEFETSVMLRFFELKPYLDECRLMLSERIKEMP